MSEIRDKIFKDIDTVIRIWLSNGADYEDIGIALTARLAVLIAGGLVGDERIVALLAEGVLVARKEREEAEHHASEGIENPLPPVDEAEDGRRNRPQGIRSVADPLVLDAGAEPHVGKDPTDRFANDLPPCALGASSEFGNGAEAWPQLPPIHPC